jgi:hypothetical protein
VVYIAAFIPMYVEYILLEVWKRRPVSATDIPLNEPTKSTKTQSLLEFDSLSDLVRSRRLNNAGFACFTSRLKTNIIPVKQVVCSHHKTITVPDHNDIYQCRIIHERFDCF